ncbi:MAG: alpha/beta hydrolase [Bacteroidales bacterium]|nr:alpha/beta hydrolase [Bacteroidales bacterium]
MLNKLLTVSLFIFTLWGSQTASNKVSRVVIQIPGKDNIQIKADYYKVENTRKPLILLFHQAGYSRGEYREIAPKLNALGFSCLAIDQRSGNKANGIVNETAKQAKQLGLATDYVSALPDLESTVDYVLKNHLSQKIILLGSSYSSSLIFVLGSEYPENTVGLIAFSPGEYFTVNGKKIADYASQIQCPVFITSAKHEQSDWKGIYKSIHSKKYFYLPKNKGIHGAKALWNAYEYSDQYWAKLKEFLDKY